MKHRKAVPKPGTRNPERASRTYLIWPAGMPLPALSRRERDLRERQTHHRQRFAVIAPCDQLAHSRDAPSRPIADSVPAKISAKPSGGRQTANRSHKAVAMPRRRRVLAQRKAAGRGDKSRCDWIGFVGQVTVPQRTRPRRRPRRPATGRDECAAEHRLDVGRRAAAK